MASASNSLPGLLLLPLALVACRGDRTPPLVGERGVRVTSGAAVEIALDPQRVPVLEGACGDGELVYRAAAGQWACASPTALLTALPPELRPVDPAVVASLSAQVDALSAHVLSIDRCSPLPDGERPPDYALAPASCLVVDSTGQRSDAYHLEDGWLVMHAPGSVRVYCALLPRCDGADGRWDRAQIRVRDPDGPGADEAVAVSVHRSFEERIPRCGGALPCTVTSALAGSSTLTLDLGGFVPDFSGAAGLGLYVAVELTSRGNGAGFGGVIID